MAEQRELITQAVVDALIAANTAAGSRVYGTRIDPYRKSQLPAISVYALNDQADADASSEMEDAHAIDLELAAWVAPAGVAPVDDAMNALDHQIRVAMRANEYLGGLASSVVYVSTAKDIGEGDGRSNLLVLTYVVTYHTPLAMT